MNYWVFSITRDNLEIVLAIRAMGFTESAARRTGSLRLGDEVTFYVPRQSLRSNFRVSKFIGIAQIISTPYPATTQIWHGGTFPVQIDLAPVSTSSCDIHPLIHKLSFIKNKVYWGTPFMNTILKVSAADFSIIQQAMREQ